jgi:hypothetical protein
MPNAHLWIAALGGGVVLLLIALIWALRRPARGQADLPTNWALSARPVFTTDERRMFRVLREALPHHVVLSKLPLVRFCQPTEAKEVRYWFELLGSANVTFAICSPNGRVLAAIDLDTEKNSTPRALQIKHAVLAACRVRYLRCSADHPPSIAELQLLVPQGSGSFGPQPAGGRSSHRREDEYSSSDWGQFSQPLPLWQDSGAFHEPAPHPMRSRSDPAFSPSMRGGLHPTGANTREPARAPNGRLHSRPAPLDDYDDREPALDDIVGVVVDAPRYATTGRPRR